MDIVKVVEWVKNGRLDNIVQANDPTGQAKQRKVCCFVYMLTKLFVPSCMKLLTKTLQDFYERGNCNFSATATDAKHVGKVHVARIKPYMVSRHLDTYSNP
jgi:hypothetical protein